MTGLWNTLVTGENAIVYLDIKKKEKKIRKYSDNGFPDVQEQNF